MKPRLLDLFSGVGGFSLGFEQAGFETAAFSEIEPFPCSVLAHHWPDVPNLGDISKITEEDVRALGKIDVVTFGSPCQDFSVAGKRLGMQGHRSSLFHEAIRVVRHARPRFALWENVPGVFSSAGGWDFAAVLDEMAELGALDIAWAVLDAQHHGVPQRRRRVFLVADFAGERAGEILSIGQSVRGDSQEGREAGQEAAAAVGGGVAAPLTAKMAKGTGGPSGDECQNLVTHALTAEGFDASEDGTGRGTPLVPTAFEPRYYSDRERMGGMPQEDVAHPLKESDHRGEDSTQAVAYTVHGEHSTAMQGNGDAQVAFPTERARNLDTTGGYANGQGGTIVHEPVTAFHSMQDPIHGDVSPALSQGNQQGISTTAVSAPGMAVRRLTPTECARLQGFPDAWCDIEYRGKPAADGPKYRAYGNGVAVPVVAWIAGRMMAFTREDAA